MFTRNGCNRSFQSAPFSIQTRKNTITKHSDKNQNLLNLATAKLNNLTCRSYTLQQLKKSI